MRTFIFLFCALSFALTPNDGIGQNAIIKIEADQVFSVDDVFDLIEQQTDYNFVYSVGIFNDSPKANLNKGKFRTFELLGKVLKNTEFTYEIVNDAEIYLYKRENVNPEVESVQVQIKIRGTVTDIDGNVLPGVNVLFGKVGSKLAKGVGTDFDGKFSIEASKGDYIRFSYVGFITQEFIIENQTEFNIILMEDTANLEEVVITGYQVLSKERVTGSYAKIDKSQLDKPSANISERLVGSVAGLQSTVKADGTIDFEIRGQSSLFADQQPLIVVDDFPIEGGFNTINPNDVESITVLKDAAAASIWGAKSANGVIVITTKNAKKGKTNVSVSSFVRASSKLDLDYVVGNASASEIIAYEQKAFDSDFFGSLFGGPPGNSPNELGSFSQSIVAMNEARLGQITDSERDATLARLAGLNNKSQIEDYLLQAPITMQYNINISGGNDKMSNNLSILFEDSKSFFKGDESSKYLINYNTKVKLANRLDFDFSGMMQYNNVDRNSGTADPIFGGGDMLSTIRELSPWDMLVNPDGSMADMSYLKYYRPNLDRHIPLSDFPYADWSYNPITEINNRDLNTKDLNTRVQAGLTYEVIDGLTLSSKIQYEMFNSNSENYYNDKTFDVRQFINETSGPEWHFGETPTQLVPGGGVLQQSKAEITAYNFRNQINFNHTFAEKHAINFVGGSEISDRIVKTTESPNAFGYNKETLSSSPLLKDIGTASLWNYYPAAYIQYFYKFNVQPKFAFTENTSRFFSLYGNLSYTFDDKYSVTGSYRTDASNIISDDPQFRYNPFWSVGFGWQLGKEDFMADATWLDRVNVRGTYGVNGNIDKSTSFRPLISLGSSLDLVTQQYLASISSYGNPTLRWEKTASYNFGVDFSILNSKLKGSVDVYNKKGTDLIVDQSISAVNGAISQKFNNGEMLNKGVEITLGTVLPLKGNDIVWTGSLTFAHNKNEITSFFKATYQSYDLYSGPTYSYVEGYDANSLWSFVYGGLTNVGTEANPVLQPSIIGENGDHLTFSGYPSGNAVNYMENQGTLVAPTTFGMRNAFRIHNFDLSFIITAKFGHVFRRQSFNYPPVIAGSGSLINGQYSAIANGDPNEVIPIPDLEGRYYFYDRFYPYMNYLTADASHIRFQEINLTYSLPSKVIDKLGLDAVNIYAQANNVGVILFNDFGEDPEFPKQSIRPQSTLTFGMQFNF